MGSAVSVKVKLKVDGIYIGGSTNLYIRGSCDNEYLNFASVNVNAQSQYAYVTLQASESLSNSVACLEDKTITWEYQSLGGSWTSFAATEHDIYVTCGTPDGSVVTDRRVEYACTVAKGNSGTDDVVSAVHAYINTHEPPAYVIDTDEVPGNITTIWKMLSPTHNGGSCIAHSNLLKHVINMLGISGGTLDWVWMSTDTNFDSQETNTVANYSCVPAAVDLQYNANYFEGCLLINSVYYPGAFGTNSYASKHELHNAYVSSGYKLIWLSRSSERRMFDKDGTQYYIVSDIPDDKCIPLR